MKNLKKLIILVIIIIIAIIGIIVYSLLTEKNRIDKEIIYQGEIREIKGEREALKVDFFQVYFQLSDCINKYINYINDNNDEAIKTILLNDYTKQIYLDDLSGIKDFEEYKDTKYTINEIYSIASTYEKPYFIKGLLINNERMQNKFFIFFLDLENETFSLKDISEEEYNKMIKGNIEFSEKNIENKVYNVNNKTYFSKDEIAKKYFYDYIENVVYYPTYAFETLNEEYVKKRFQDYNEYRDYLKNNIETFKLIEMNRAKSSNDFKTQEEYSKYFSEKYLAGLQKYQVNKTDEYTQYICIDGSDNYYIFNVKDDFSYDVILDTYTIDLPQFTEKYNSSNAQQKVAMNIDKFIKSLNNKDYKYAYNCLAEGFKNNKFNNIEIFEKFMEQNVFEKNNIEFKDFKNEGETYIFNIILKNAEKDSETKNMQIIMKLGEGTDFVMSFNIN